ncbi:ABC transporter permease [Vannielia sp.]|uniref:ABC transporter permease n=1 Tax=Vannielia sp. TaxID=2813045 RepID=UPI0026264D24|nr:ABC transporter permease [Vannielia sp.]MDF1873029.1 ABC transporter permease [Vannielia sp.]
MSEATDTSGPVLAADGTPLKRSLARALRRQKLRALGLVAPLLLFVLVTFIAPIADMLFRSVENDIVADTLPRTVVALKDWRYDGGEIPDEPVFAALYADLAVAVEKKEHTRLGSRLNYETTGTSSLFRKTGRRVDDIGEHFQDQLEGLDDAWKNPETIAAIFAADPTAERYRPRDGVAAMLPRASAAYAKFAAFTESEGDVAAEEKPWELIYAELYADLTAGQGAPYEGPEAALVRAAVAAVPGFEPLSFKEAFIEVDDGWESVEIWGTIKAYSPRYTPGYFLNAVDMQLTPEGIERQDEGQRIYGLLFKRTLFMSLAITISCILLAYPVAWILANLPMRTANLLMILVLLPFWTSLLVRTSAWKVLLQQQGVINDIIVWLGLGKFMVWVENAWNWFGTTVGFIDPAMLVDFASNEGRLTMINNQFGTIVAMTHILLPFMILPMYSVMQTIPPTYMRAAKSLGATNWTAFWRVYFPQSVPGIGAGSILVFILAIGYYITPELVGGTTGTFISNRIAYHISSSLNWGLAAALGAILLAAVLLLYWAYDKIVGIDNVKLG